MTTKHEPEEPLENDDVETAQSKAVEHPESEQEQSQQEDTAHGTDGDGGATDWKAQARKWERRAKQYKVKLDTAEQNIKQDEPDVHDGDLAKRIAELEAENQQLKASGERRTLIEQVANDTGIPARLLHGDSEEDLRAVAESLREWASTLGNNTPTSLGSEPDTSQSANLELIRELFNEQ